MSIREFIVVDLETTGLHPYVDKIVEIGIVKASLDTTDKEILIDKIVREEGFGESHRNSWLFRNSDITFEEAVKGVPFGDVVPDLVRIFGTYPSTAFNRDFDFGFLAARGIMMKHPLPCPMKVSTDILKLPKKRNGRGYRNGNRNNDKYKWPKFQEAYGFYFNHVPYREEHRAIDDAIHEADLIRCMFERGHYRFEIEKV